MHRTQLVQGQCVDRERRQLGTDPGVTKGNAKEMRRCSHGRRIETSPRPRREAGKRLNQDTCFALPSSVFSLFFCSVSSDSSRGLHEKALSPVTALSDRETVSPTTLQNKKRTVLQVANLSVMGSESHSFPSEDSSRSFPPLTQALGGQRVHL